MKSHTTRRYRERLAALPEHVRRSANQAYSLFKNNPSHPGLRFKQVHNPPPTYSVRVGMGYRTVAMADGFSPEAARPEGPTPEPIPNRMKPIANVVCEQLVR